MKPNSCVFTGSFQLRRAMVDQKTGSERLRVRKHMDHMKRATVLDQTYFHQVGDHDDDWGFSGF